MRARVMPAMPGIQTIRTTLYAVVGMCMDSTMLTFHDGYQRVFDATVLRLFALRHAGRPHASMYVVPLSATALSRHKCVPLLCMLPHTMWDIFELI